MALGCRDEAAQTRLGSLPGQAVLAADGPGVRALGRALPPGGAGTRRGVGVAGSIGGPRCGVVSDGLGDETPGVGEFSESGPQRAGVPVYKPVLKIELEVSDATLAKRPRLLPEVSSKAEVTATLNPRRLIHTGFN